MKTLETVRVGVIADDFTGASDAASFLQKGGLSTVLLNGVPDDHQALHLEDYQAIVIALKIRTEPVDEAVQQAVEAANWLEQQGVNRYLYKYCSTMDSTPQGNIGPILDTLIEKLGVNHTIVSPALPVNGRTVRNGHLYVNGVPLDESPMRHHPLTPMWTSDLAEIMEAQGQFESLILSREELMKDEKIIKTKLNEFGQGKKAFYVMPDFEDESDSQRIVELFGSDILLSGSSGYMEAYAQKLTEEGGQVKSESLFGSVTAGPAIILAGSVSEATREQVAYYKANSGEEYYEIDPLALLDGSLTSDIIWKQVADTIESKKDLLIYSAHAPEAVKKAQAHGKLEVGSLIENVLSDLAEKSYASGYHRIIVGGGETSGAITKRLGFKSYSIEESVAPGVPIMVPLQNTEVRLILKSGNFGQEDFFQRASQLTKGER